MGLKAAQQCVHPTGGSLRVFEQFSWLGVGSGKAAFPRPAHQRVTPAVGRFASRIIQGSRMRRNKVKTSFFVTCISLLIVFIIGQIILEREPASNNFPLRQAWKTQLRGKIYGISTADDERVFVRTSASLNALEAKSGKVIWSHSVSWQADAKPAIAKNGKVYVTGGNLVLALDQKTGAVLWKQTMTYSSTWITDVSEDVIIVNQLGIDIMVFDADTGEFLWRKPVCRGYVEAFTDGNNIYIPCDGLEAIDIKSGNISWTADIGVIGDIGHSQDVIYYFSGAVDAYDLRTQETLWSTAVANTGFENFRIINDALFYTDDVRVCRLDIDNGHLEWCAKTAYPQTPAVIDNNVYVFDGSHKTVTAFQITDGQEIGTLNLSNLNYFIIERKLLASNNNLLFFANGKDIYAYAKQELQ